MYVAIGVRDETKFFLGEGKGFCGTLGGNELIQDSAPPFSDTLRVN